MTPLNAVLDRIAHAGGALRVRAIEADRLERNGGGTAERQASLHELVKQLQAIADKLEAALQ